MSHEEGKQMELVVEFKKKGIKLNVHDTDTIESVLETLREKHDVPDTQSLLLLKRELKTDRTLRSYLIGTEHRGNVLQLSSLQRRDKLIKVQNEVQELWEQNKIFETDAPEQKDDEEIPKFMVTFPYPYMNGLLHVGHGFSLSKAEFAAGYQRLKGKKVLFPFGFHCTGMPIAACAKKLEREIAKFGNPPVFPLPPKEEEKEETAKKAGKKKGKNKKGKQAKKKSKALYQWQILQEMNVDEHEIPEFTDPLKWLDYFPPKGMAHLKKFGLKSDFRRSFITTSQNPYYDSFIRWQFNTLHARDYVKFGNRATVYSPLDSQPCADHDRAEGEQKQPQEFTLIKMKLIQEETPYTKAHDDKLEPYYDHDIFFVPATLRPETMYGQTNCWIFPNGDYVLLKVANGTDDSKPVIYICSEQSARNMVHQNMVPDLEKDFGKMNVLRKVKGWDLLGRKCTAPNSKHDFVYVMPLSTIKMDKGTGIVTSVPSDAPDDWIALMDIQNDAKARDKYFITEEMANYDVVPIIQTGVVESVKGEKGEEFEYDFDYGTIDFKNDAAGIACKLFGVKNQFSARELKAAKKIVYKYGYYDGVMDIGPHKGTPVETVKDIIRAEMIERGDAAVYFEPESRVMSRSGDLCVVAYVDQWYLRYGSDKQEWMDRIMNHVQESLECYNPKTKKKFVEAVDWLKQWACSRSFGLGTFLPFDDQYVIESLSDSTIYMAYYTVAHLLQKGILDGSGLQDDPSNVQPEALTHAFWDSLFLTGVYPENCQVPEDTWKLMRQEFEFWYPMDLRVSGKDLIGNHLTMSLYNHAAIWEDRDMLPRSFYTNGHSQIDGEKMSKSTGNFLTLIDCIEQFSADATRLALADAGDDIEDANFSGDTCNAAILHLTKLETWILENHYALHPDAEPVDAIKEKLEQMQAENQKSYDAGDFARCARLQPRINELQTQVFNSTHNITSTSSQSSYRGGPFETFADRAFANELNVAVIKSDEAYKSMQFRIALRQCFYDLINARNRYVDYCSGQGLHRELAQRFIDVIPIILSPICPHFCEYIWQKLGKPGFVVNSTFPTADPEDDMLSRQSRYVTDNSHDLRVAFGETKKGKGKKGKKKKKGNIAQTPPDSVYIYISQEYPQYKKLVINILAEEYESKNSAFQSLSTSELKKYFRPKFGENEVLKEQLQDAMMFQAFALDELEKRGTNALELKTPFDELELCRNNGDLIIRGTDLKNVQVFDANDADTPGPENKKSKAVPGKFSVYFYSSQDS